MAASALVMFPMMIADRIFRILQLSCHKRSDGCIGIACHTGINADSELRKCILRTAADAAADQRIYLILRKYTGQRTVSGFSVISNPGVTDRSVFDFIDFKLRCSSKMLKNRPVRIIGNCYIHSSKLLSVFFILSYGKERILYNF